MRAPCALKESPPAAGCRWQLTLSDAVTLRTVAADEGLLPGEWCARAIQVALGHATARPVPPTGLAPRPADKDARSFLAPMAGPGFFGQNSVVREQMIELLAMWEDYRAGRLVPVGRRGILPDGAGEDGPASAPRIPPLRR